MNRKGARNRGQMWDNETAGQITLPGRYTPWVPTPTGGAMVSITPRTDRPASGQQPEAPTSVYRYYDDHGILVYVGITSRGMGRNVEHNKTKDWWQFVARQDVEHFATRPEAHAREVALIREFRPPFNVQHNPGHTECRRAYEAMRELRKLPPADAPGPSHKRLELIQHEQDHARTILRSTGPVETPLIGVEPTARTNSRRRKYGAVRRAWRQGAFVMIEISGSLPPVVPRIHHPQCLRRSGRARPDKEGTQARPLEAQPRAARDGSTCRRDRRDDQLRRGVLT